MGKLYGTRKHGVMAHNGEVSGGAVWIDLDIQQVVYPVDESNYETNHDLLDPLIQQIDEAYEAGKMIYIRAWNHYANDEIGMYSENPNTEAIFSLVGRTDYVEGAEPARNKTFLFAAAYVANETAPCFIQFDATTSDIYAGSSGLFYYAD